VELVPAHPGGTFNVSTGRDGGDGNGELVKLVVLVESTRAQQRYSRLVATRHFRATVGWEDSRDSLFQLNFS
jgi:hypothetical protein